MKNEALEIFRQLLDLGEGNKVNSIRVERIPICDSHGIITSEEITVHAVIDSEHKGVNIENLGAEYKS